jgi:hypothetical protein
VIAFAEAGRKVVMVLFVPAAHFIAITVTIAVMVPVHHGLRACHGHGREHGAVVSANIAAGRHMTVFSIACFPGFLAC